MYSENLGFAVQFILVLLRSDRPKHKCDSGGVQHTSNICRNDAMSIDIYHGNLVVRTLYVQSELALLSSSAASFSYSKCWQRSSQVCNSNRHTGHGWCFSSAECTIKNISKNENFVQVLDCIQKQCRSPPQPSKPLRNTHVMKSLIKVYGIQMIGMCEGYLQNHIAHLQEFSTHA